MPRILHLAAAALLAYAALSANAQNATAPAPLSIVPPPTQPRPEDVIAAFRAAMDTVLQQGNAHQQFLYTLEMDEAFSTADGRSLGSSSRKFENLYIAGKPYSRLIEKDGKPLSKKEAAEEDKKYNAALANHNSFTTSDHFTHTVHGVNYSLKDVQSSYSLRYIGWETIGGRRLWRIEAFPPPPSPADTNPLPPIKITFWLDEQMKTIVRDDSLLYQPDDQLLAGSHDSEEYTQVDGFYCKTLVTSHLELRTGNVIDSRHIFTNYRRFTTTIKILPDTETALP